MNWKCDRCGSKEVQQEYSVMLSMNKEDGWEQAIENCYGNDFYYCEQCKSIEIAIIKFYILKLNGCFLL